MVGGKFGENGFITRNTFCLACMGGGMVGEIWGKWSTAGLVAWLGKYI